MSAEEPLRADFTLTDDDVFRYVVYNQRHSPLLVGIVVVYLLVLLVVATDLAATNFPSAPMGVAVLCGLAAVLGFSVLIRWALWIKAKRIGRALVGIKDETTVEISPEGLYSSSPRGEGRLNWTAFVRIVGTRDAILLYQGKRHAAIVPRRAFPTHASAERFLRAAQEWHEAETSMPQR